PGRGGLRRRAGLPVQHHYQLDVLHRPLIHGDRALLPARSARFHPARRPRMNVLEVSHASKRFGSLVAVRDISLTVKKGELRAIIGPNGAGKTTFFNLISGLFPPSEGKIAFEGRDVTALPAEQRVTLGIARTFQITEIFPELTVFENVRTSTEVADGHR